MVVLLVATAAAACSSPESPAKEDAPPPATAWRELVVAAIAEDFPEGLDKSESNPNEGVFWTAWHYEMRNIYRDSKRRRAHVRITENAGKRTADVVEVWEETNDNIDDPLDEKKARWVVPAQDAELAARLRRRVEEALRTAPE